MYKPLGSGLADVAQKGWTASSCLLCKIHVVTYFYFYTTVQCYLGLFYAYNSQKFIYNSWKNSLILMQTNEKIMHMFLKLKDPKHNKNNTVISDQMVSELEFFSGVV